MINTQSPRVLITGCTGNLGQACIMLATHRGWDYELVSRQRGLDLSNWDATEQFVTRDSNYDMVIMAHGAHCIISAGDTTEGDYRYVLDNNLASCVSLTSALLRHLKLNPGGLLVYCSSIQATHTRAGRALYAASKAGIEGYMRGVAAELADGRRALALRMGQLDAQMHDVKLDDVEIARLQARCYIAWNKPADVAKLIFDLYAQPGITGCCLDVDSGQGNNIWSS